ncbi:MAG: SDR family oxidoreductase [Clostridia bacterium]|nr:SDR family oxidoreductase [Clostridia bacterium]
MENIELRPKSILVLGGGSGIGFAVAQALLNNGAQNVILASRNVENLSKASKELKRNKKQGVYTVQCDISNVSENKAVIERANALLGRGNTLDGLVISSGVNFDASNWKGWNISEQDWDRVMDVNLKGVFFFMRDFGDYLYNNKIKGNICIISSISAHRDMLSVYQISKHSISRIVNAYGKHLCERGVVLNCVEPGPIHTDMMKHLEKYTDGKKKGEPWNDASIRRLVRVDEIADIVCFLMSNLGEVMSGDCIVAAGGTKSIFPI